MSREISAYRCVIFFNFCSEFTDLLLIKRFCEDILAAIDMLNAGNCSLKGFLCCKLYEVHAKLKKLHVPDQSDKVEYFVGFFFAK